jgi:3-carboxy-cis,cis-muconate cycloisomerase
MRDVWSDENRTAKYLDIERALAKVQGQLGIIPQEAADEIVRTASWTRSTGQAQGQDRADRLPDHRRGQPDQRQLPRQAGRVLPLGRHHAGHHRHRAVLQIREGLALVDADLGDLGRAGALARTHRDTPIIGRSNLQQATPITFGYKMASILAGIERHRERLQQLKPRVLVGEFGGASGTLSSLESGAMETQAGLMKELGLGSR